MSGVNLIDLRAGGAGDLGAVDALMRRAFDPRFGEAWTRAQCLGILSMPGVWLTLALLNGHAAGFALARATGEEAELLLLATEPTVRRRGVGGALLRSIIEEARSRRVAKLFLEVRAGNPAIALYDRLGFTKVGERKGYYRGASREVFDAYTFCLMLS